MNVESYAVLPICCRLVDGAADVYDNVMICGEYAVTECNRYSCEGGAMRFFASVLQAET